jgi:hypothetical protein
MKPYNVLEEISLYFDVIILMSLPEAPLQHAFTV